MAGMHEGEKKINSMCNACKSICYDFPSSDKNLC